jgi:hypothetical protein
MGLDEDEIRQFVSGIYESCKKMALEPDKVVYLLKLLLHIPESVPPMQFEEYIQLQKSHIRMSKEKIERLEQRITKKLTSRLPSRNKTRLWMNSNRFLISRK